MLVSEFETLLKVMESEEHAVVVGKGKEYTRGQEDRLASFKEIAAFSGVRPEQVCLIFMAKHWQSLANYVKTEQTHSSETVQSRIMDLRVYLALMRAIVEEKQQEELATREEHKREPLYGSGKYST